MSKKQAVLSLSGGMDSSTLLLHLLAAGYEVTALSFDYGQKHKVELERAASLVSYINGTSTSLSSKVIHQIIKLQGLSELLNSSLVEGGEDVPEGHYEQSNMKETVVPNRNKIFSSIIQAVALSLATKDTGHGQIEKRDVVIAMGIHAGDHCFSKYTDILTPNGLKTVKELKEGDPIFSFNLETNKWELDKVTAIIKKNVVDTLLRIETNSEYLDVTEEHKVYRLQLSEHFSTDERKIEKVKASELKEGDLLVQPGNLPVEGAEELLSQMGTEFTAIQSITSMPYNDHVYDITVERNHNFAAGRSGFFLISNSIYPDCRQEFRDVDMEAFRIGNWDSDLVQMSTPYLEVNKLDILKDGAACCTALGLEFDEVYSRTNTSYKPIWIPVQKLSGVSGAWYSDYKSAASVERIEAFINLERPDPVEYADENGPVDWDTVKSHVEQVLELYHANKEEVSAFNIILDSDVEFI